jgi:hypothetical protein
MEQFNTLVNDKLGWIHENKYVLPFVIAFLGMYGALARPKIPTYIEKLFQNTIFRLVVISYVIYRGNSDPQLSLTIVAVFLLIMHSINKKSIEGLCDRECRLKNKQNKQDAMARRNKDGRI